MKQKALSILILMVIGLGTGFLFLRDKHAPALTLQPENGLVSVRRPPVLTLEDPGTGLKSLAITLSQNGKVTELVNESFAKGTERHRVTLDLAKSGIQEGPFSLQVEARDHAFWRNKTSQRLDLKSDLRPPSISVLSTAHNVYQGGSGLVLYRVSKEVERTGVQIGKHFFPAFQQENGVWACLFPFPHDLERGDFVPRLVATDLAGNERTGGFFYNTLGRPARADRINISRQFLDNKMPEFQHYFPGTTDSLELFLRVNREMRDSNRARLNKLAAQTAPRPLWQGPFLRLPNSAQRADFADRRSYYLDGQLIDEQTHMGIDLASLANSPVPAANSGVVVMTEDLGIYGQCIVIDHGLGLQSLYAHLSSMAVKVGDQVEKGQIIGNTGATGMAAGDHLHYEMLVGGLSVHPREWWDAGWVTNNFTAKWDQAMGQAAGQQ